MDERFSHYQLVKSKSGLTVPYIDNVYLHSMYNPAKEAQGFAKLNEQTLQYKQNVIILGLGFGYHVEEVAKILNQYHKAYKVIIIEPNEQLYRDFIAKRNFEDKRLLPIHVTDPAALFMRKDFVEFLLMRPAIIKHDTSFMLNKDFFTKFLTFKAQTGINHLAKTSEHIQHFLNDDEQACTLDEHAETIMQSKRLSHKDRLLLAFNEVAKERRL